MQGAPRAVAKSRPLSVLEGVNQLLRRWYIIVLAAAVGAGVVYKLKDRLSVSYQSKAAIRVTQSLPTTKLNSGIQLPREEQLDPENLAKSLVQEALTSERLDRLFAAKPALFKAQIEGSGKKVFVAWVRKHATITPMSSVRYAIKAWGKTPAQAKELAAWITAGAVKGHQQIMMGRVGNLTKFLKLQKTQAQTKLSAHEASMIAFLRSNPGLMVAAISSDRRLATSGPDRLRVRATRRVLNAASTKVSGGDAELRALMDQRAQLRAELRGLDNNDDGSAPTSGTAKLRELQRARATLDALKARGLSESHPDVKRGQRKVKRLQAEAANVKPGQVTGASTHQLKLRQKLREVTLKLRTKVKRAKTSPRKEAEWQQLVRQQQLLLRQHESFDKLFAEADLRSRLGAREAERLAFVVEPASMPVKPRGVKPKVLLAAGVALAALLGTVLALLLGALDRRLYKPQEVTALLGLPLLCALDQQSKKQALRGSRQTHNSAEAMMAWSTREELVVVGMRLPRHAQQEEDAPLMAEDSYQHEMNWPQLPAHEPSDEFALATVDHDAGAMVPGGARPAEETVNLRIHSVIASPPAAAGVLLATSPSSRGADQLRLAADRVLDAPGYPGGKVVVVTSWRSAVGRTTVAANLAMACAEARRRTLLIDTCNGDPACTRLFGLRPEDDELLQTQLSAHLNGMSDGWSMYKLAETLSLVPAGTQERAMASLLQSAAFATMMDQLRRIFDVIIIDSAAQSEVSDASVLQQYADATVLVTRRKRSRLPGIAKAVAQLERDRIAGVVFNKF